jgi:hypothetical protein
VLLEATSDQDAHSTLTSPGKYLLGQAGLADPRLAGQEYNPARTSQYCVQRRQDPREFDLPADESPTGLSSAAGARRCCSRHSAN